MLASGTEAAVVDASLDPKIYFQLARTRGWTIRHVFDTHVHMADRAGARTDVHV